MHFKSSVQNWTLSLRYVTFQDCLQNRFFSLPTYSFSLPVLGPCILILSYTAFYTKTQSHINPHWREMEGKEKQKDNVDNIMLKTMLGEMQFQNGGVRTSNVLIIHKSEKKIVSKSIFSELWKLKKWFKTIYGKWLNIRTAIFVML